MSIVNVFEARYSFEFDDFQRKACQQIAQGSGVLVAAPTGSGKTVVGEFGAWLAIREGRKCFYTTPIKALSNQKYHDLLTYYGQENIGLLTGDRSINSQAPIVVMTTEVLRNMIYAKSDMLQDLGYVVMDEVHYLADRIRGGVWEEVILGLAPEVILICLSATVSNAEEFGEWLDQVRGDVAVVLSEKRPVPLEQHMVVGNQIEELFIKGKVNPKLIQLSKEESRTVRDDSRNPRSRRGRGKKFVSYGSGQFGGAASQRYLEKHSKDKYGNLRPKLTPSRAQTVRALNQQNLLPAIIFVFSRSACDAAVRQLLGTSITLTKPRERVRLLEIANAAGQQLADGDKQTLGWQSFVEALARGFAAHHAGLLPAFKTVVEQAFSEGLLKVVFATETLALGINMPARSVVLEKLVKFNGQINADITAGEYTQLTGRAGRRGIDSQGHALVWWQPGIDPRALARLASTRTYPLRSSFTPNYNMAINLVSTLGRERAHTILERSFAQFQADQKILKYTKGLDNKVRSRANRRSHSLVNQFDHILQVLDLLGYLADDEVTDIGKMLAKIYNEFDLVIAEVIRQDILSNLTIPQLAAVLSSFVYEPRKSDGGYVKMPDRESEQAQSLVRRIWRDVGLVEQGAKMEKRRAPDIGFAQSAYFWASGMGLAEVLNQSRLSAGDFVRNIRQIIDLAIQISNAPGTQMLRRRTKGLVEVMRRDLIDFEDE